MAYQTTALRMRQRLELHGFTAARAYNDVREKAEEYAKDPRRLRTPVVEGRERFETYMKDIESAIEALLHDAGAPLRRLHPLDLGERYISRNNNRSYLRFVLDQISDDTLVSLYVSNYIVHRLAKSSGSIVQEARSEQLARLPADAPLIVLTEGPTDSRLLSAAMEITHPHLVEFVNFIDFTTHRAEGSVSTLAKTVATFAAAGVANRFLAIADNDTAAHSALIKVKSDKTLPNTCRVLHYPYLDLLTRYPTLGPYGQGVVLADVNGRAGSLELYLGRDVLTIDGNLAPIQWQHYDSKLGRYHGALSDHDKKRVQKAFEEKIKSARMSGGAPSGDWTGIEAIMNTIITAFMSVHD
ncbi:hypothetical protein GCM10022214_20040 [Actinomadura miaoliensis]|uniref:HEPN/Toprim N-terminal domain-containing protein n=1 Tax=Actinomadura miaoliensis TaxID=430685 RepID=A0ABP7VF37_9ACTN